MTSLKKNAVWALLCLVSSPAWSERVDFCKVSKVYDENNMSMPPRIVYEDCSGEAYLGSIGKDLLKASCWAGATDILEGKCEGYKDKGADCKSTSTEASETGVQKD